MTTDSTGLIRQSQNNDGNAELEASPASLDAIKGSDSDNVHSTHLPKMQAQANHSTVSEFLLQELTEVRELQILQTVLFLVLYLAILTGNFLIMSAIAFDHRLHTPMYFFLMNLAVCDIGSVSVIVPESMANSLLNTRLISYSGCVSQVFFYMFFAASDLFLLTVMAYDRYVAIGNPLRYEMVMNRKACLEMVACVWISGLFIGALNATSTFAAPFCSNVVTQFFCEIPQLLKITCSDLNLIELGVLTFGFTCGVVCFLFISVSYMLIFTDVLRMPSVQGRRKAFSTCLPHLIIILTFIAPMSVAYLRPPSKVPSHLDLAVTIIYSMIPPLVNPMIYSMRNKDIQATLSVLLGMWTTSRNRSAPVRI